MFFSCMLLAVQKVSKKEPSERFVHEIEGIIKKEGLGSTYNNLPTTDKLNIMQSIHRKKFIHPHHKLSEVGMLRTLQKNEKKEKKRDGTP